MTPIVQIIFILCATFAVVCITGTLDNIFGKNNKDKGDEQ